MARRRYTKLPNCVTPDEGNFMKADPNSRMA
jgi:hypothetical protein